MKAVFLSFALFVFALSLYGKSKQDYDELYRPQSHFSPTVNWMGNPSGLIYQNGEYHLFYQLNPYQNQSGQFNLGHAVSTDLVTWTNLPVAIKAEALDTSDVRIGSAWSGSVIIDENNLLKKQTSSSKTWVMFYSVFKKGIKIAYSTDNGRNWSTSENSPSIPNLDPESRDSKVFWYEPTKTWVMLIYRKPGSDEFQKGFSIYNSKDLIHWEYKSHIPGFYESPDLFQLPLNNRKNDIHWVLTSGNGNYQIGTFNGETFTPETEELKYDYGKNFYSPLTWKTNDDKIIQIASLRGAIYPDMPFTGQMTFPCEVSLQKFTEGIRLCRKPVENIELLHDNLYEWKEKNIYPGLNKNILSGLEGDCFHIQVSFNVKTSDTFGILVRKGKEGLGTEIMYTAKNKVLSCMDQNIIVEPNDGNIDLDIIVDRSSIEIFTANGKASITNNFNPEPKDQRMMLFTIGGEVLVNNLKVYRLNSIYQPLKKIKKK